MNNGSLKKILFFTFYVSSKYNGMKADMQVKRLHRLIKQSSINCYPTHIAKRTYLSTYPGAWIKLKEQYWMKRRALTKIIEMFIY